MIFRVLVRGFGIFDVVPLFLALSVVADVSWILFSTWILGSFLCGLLAIFIQKNNHFVFSWIIVITLIGVWDKTFKINLIYVLKCDNFFTHFFYLSNFITCIAKFPYTKLNNIFIILLVIHLENILKFLNQYLNFVNQY